jgi:hypothetical protein
MKRYRVTVVIRTLEIYEVEADSPEDAEDYWSDGDLIHADDESLETEVWSVRKVRS